MKMDKMNKLIELFKTIKVIRFEVKLYIHVYKEKPVEPDPEIAPLGTKERVRQMEAKRNEYRRLHKEAMNAHKEAMLEKAAGEHLDKLERRKEREIDLNGSN